MVLRVRPTPTSTAFFIPVGQHTFAFYTKCVAPVGHRFSAVIRTKLTVEAIPLEKHFAAFPLIHYYSTLKEVHRHNGTHLR